MGDRIILWILNVFIAILSAINAISWGYAVRDVGEPYLSLHFVLKLLFNKFFILAMASAFTAALLSYIVMSRMGILVGRFFLSIQIVAMMLACTVVLGEKLTLREWLGVLLIITGVLVIGKW